MKALEGLKVVEAAAYAAGPVVGKHLVDQGATVVHVESRIRPDGFRTHYPPYKDNIHGLNRSGLFALCNSEKLGVTLNLKKGPEALALAKRIVSWADVLVENFSPGTIGRLGLGYETLKEVNPRLIMLSSSNLGQTGPHAHHPGFGSQLSSLAGFTNLTGYRDGSPQILYGPYIDYIAVGYGVVAVLAALEYREATGRGQHIDLAQYETGLQYLAPLLLDYTLNGDIAERDGNRHPEAAPHGAFPCAGDDNWCVLSVASDEQWRALCHAMDRPEWAAVTSTPPPSGGGSGRTSWRRASASGHAGSRPGRWWRSSRPRASPRGGERHGPGLRRPAARAPRPVEPHGPPGDRRHVVPAGAVHPVGKRRRPGPPGPPAGGAQRVLLPRAAGTLAGRVRHAHRRGGHRLGRAPLNERGRHNRARRRAFAAMTAHASETYPEECCGVILGGAGRDEVHRLVNIQNMLHATDPETFSRDARTAYTLDPRELEAVLERAENRGLAFKALYHSHPDHDAYFSAEDRACATPFGEPTYPTAAQIVISVLNGRVGRVAAYAWSPDAGDFVETALERVPGR